jgi:hypothetical protein
METKQCTKCKEVKPKNNKFFGKRLDAKDHFTYWCKQCLCNNTSKWQKNNPEKMSDYIQNPKYKQNHKLKQTSIIGIYEWIDNDISLYIGQSSWLYSRMNTHKSWFKKPSLAPKAVQPLYKALNNHPNASIRVIEECPREVLLEREQHYIDAKKPLYNALKNKHNIYNKNIWQTNLTKQST